MPSPFAALGLSDDASVAEVRAAWRELAVQQHPDKGGDAAAFAELGQAYREAVRLAALRLCPTCSGRGTIDVVRGFVRLPMTCQRCGGGGKA